MILVTSVALASGAGIAWVEAPTVHDGQLHARVHLARPVPAEQLALALGHRRVEASFRPSDAAGSTILLSFDASGSFRRFTDAAHSLAGASTSWVGGDRQVGVLAFGRSARAWPPTSDPDVLRQSLAASRAAGADQQETRLAAFLLDGIDRLAAARPEPDGLRRMIVFTDAGEESKVFDTDEVIAHARLHRVVIDAVVFARPQQRGYAEDLDRLTRIARKTGGDVLELHDGQADAAGFRALLERELLLVDVRAPACGTSPPQASLTGPDGLHAAPVALQGTLQPCRASAVGVGQPADRPEAAGAASTGTHATDPAPGGAQTDPAGGPVEPSGGGTQASSAPTGGPSTAVGVLCLGLLIAVFAGLLAVGAWLVRRNDAPDDADEPAPPPSPNPEPAPPAAPAAEVLPPAAKVTGDESAAMSTNLPETHLVVIAGGLALGTRWRFPGRILRVGAQRENNDIVVDLPQVSGTHARFELSPNGDVHVEDLGSSNGTWIDGVRLTPNQRSLVPPDARVSLSSQLTLQLSKPTSRTDET